MRTLVMYYAPVGGAAIKRTTVEQRNWVGCALNKFTVHQK